MELAPNPH